MRRMQGSAGSLLRCWLLSLLPLVGGTVGCVGGPDTEATQREITTAPVAASAVTEDMDDNIKVLLLLAKGDEVDGRNAEETRKNYAGALEIYHKILDAGANGRGAQEAYFGVGRCEAKLNHLWQAHQALEKSYPPRFEASAVHGRVQLQYDIANHLLAMGLQAVPGAQDGKKKLNGLEAGSRVLERVVYNDPDCAEGPPALLKLGDCRVRLKDLNGAEAAYRRLIRNHGTTRESFLARASLAKILIGREYDGPVPPEALKEAKHLLRKCIMLEPRTPELKQRVAEAKSQRLAAGARDLLKQARFHLHSGNRGSAIFLLRDVMRLYPDTEAARDAEKLLRRLGQEPGEYGGKRHDKKP